MSDYQELLSYVKQLERRLAQLERQEFGGGGDHGTLSGLGDDDHTQYLLASTYGGRTTFGTNWTDLTDSGATTLHKHDHGGQDGLSDDDHSQYALLAGRSGGQSINGGTAANDDLTLQGTSSSTRDTSYVIIQPNGGGVGVGTTAPPTRLSVRSATASNNSAIDLISLESDRDDRYSGLSVVRGSANYLLGIGFVTSNNAAPAERMRLNPDGKLGVGRTATTDTLETEGTMGLYITNAVNFSSGVNVYKRGATGDATAALASNGEIGYHSFYGWNGSAYVRGSISIVTATENWSSTGMGCKYSIYTTANGSTANTERLTIQNDGTIGIGVSSPGGKLDVQQTSTTAAIPTLALTQSDVSEEFIEFDGTVAAGNPIDTAAIGTYYGKVRVSVNGTFKYLPVYNS